MQIALQTSELAAICEKYRVKKLAVFGSALRDDFDADSDVDVLVEFESGHKPGFIGLGFMEEELSSLMNDRPVDLVTVAFLNPRLRDRVLADAVVVYER